MSTTGSKRPFLDILATEVELWKSWAQMSTKLTWQEMDAVNRLGKALCYQEYGSSTATLLASWADVQRILYRMIPKK